MKKAILITGLLLVIIVTSSCGTDYRNSKFSGHFDSPNNWYSVNVYMIDYGATTDYSVTAVALDNRTNTQREFYHEYHKSSAEVSWNDEYTININGHILDIRKDKLFK
jgi:hypothetical protein